MGIDDVRWRHRELLEKSRKLSKEADLATKWALIFGIAAVFCQLVAVICGFLAMYYR